MGLPLTLAVLSPGKNKDKEKIEPQKREGWLGIGPRQPFNMIINSANNRLFSVLRSSF